MEIRSIYKGARLSAFKCREVTREIQGLSVSNALDLLTHTPRKAARLVEKTLRSAVANAEHNANLRADRLVVKEAVVGEGPTMKRFRPRAQGRAARIRKRTSHITVVLESRVAEEPKKKASAKKAATKAEAAAPAKKASAKIGRAHV